jgi:hypothetical protein
LRAVEMYISYLQIFIACDCHNYEGLICQILRTICRNLFLRRSSQRFFHRAPTETTLIFCTEFYYHANIITNDNTRSLEKFLYENLYHPEFVQFDLDRKIMRHLLDPTITSFDQSACRRGEFLCAGTRVRLYPNIKKILYFIRSRAFWAYTIL